MKTREQVIKTNARKREFRWTARGALKGLLISIIIVVLLITAILGIFYGLHYSKTQKDIKILTAYKMYDIYEVDDVDTNIYISKGKDSKHTIVSIADIGDHTFGIYTNMIFEKVKNDVTIVNIDRPGYGMSSDTKEDRTVENIVEHYRAALQEVNIEEPVVLFTYGFGSVYAAEWANQYPDEIKAIVNINGTVITEDNKDIESYEMTKKDKFFTVGNYFGLQRIFYNDWFNDMHRELSHEDEECVQIMNTHSAKTFALYSEMALKEKNFKTVLENWKENDIPTFYIATEHSMEKDEDVSGYVEYMNALSLSREEEPFYNASGAEYDKYIADCIDESTKYHNEVLKPFFDKYGNLHVIKIPGYPQIYKQKAIAMDNFAKDFVKWLNDDIATMNSRYENEFPKPQQTEKPEEAAPTDPTTNTEPTGENNSN